jgi:endonuclease/exonuclease/phosphatase family metal-dependent hydrolase
VAVLLRVLSYNVHGLKDDRAALSRVVRAAAPDVVFVQEAPRRFRWRSRSAELARQCGLFVGAGGGPALGNLILVSERVRVLADRPLRFPLRPGRHLRGIALADCEVAGVRFTAAGTHLSTDAQERLDQADRLAAVLSAQPAPLVVGADLNEPPGGAAWHRLLSAKLADTATGNPATYPASAPHSRLDAVLTDAATECLRYEVVADRDTRAASDHLPVLVEITVA